MSATPLDKDLPVLHVTDFLTDPNQEVPARLVSPALPRRFLLEAQEFVDYFNNVLFLDGPKAMSRRTIQFYASSNAGVFPSPIYKNRHTAHYIYPDHFYRLCVIWTLRERFFLPVKLIRSLLEDLPPDRYELVIQWGGSAEELLEMLPFLKQGFDHEDFFIYQASKGLLTRDTYPMALENLSEENLKRGLLDKLEHECAMVRNWISSGRGARFIMALTQARGAHPEPIKGRRAHVKKASKPRAGSRA